MFFKISRNTVLDMCIISKHPAQGLTNRRDTNPTIHSPEGGGVHLQAELCSAWIGPTHAVAPGGFEPDTLRGAHSKL
jgi:hypothetical protein